MTDADEAWMVWLTSAELARRPVSVIEREFDDVLGWSDLCTLRDWRKAIAHSDFEAWIDALMVGREG